MAADATSVRARLEMLAAAQELPTLSPTDITTILDMARVTDEDGRTPDDTGYVPTWDLNLACYLAWKVKAGRVAGMWSFTADGQTISKGDLLDHCERMMAQYAVGGDVAVAPLPAGLVVPDNFVIGS